MIDMSTWVSTKAQTTPDEYLSASVRPWDIANKRGIDRPFNYATAVAQYRGWFYAAIWMNAKAVATTPMRLYVRKGTGEKLVQSRSINTIRPRQKRFMMGQLRHQPSAGVMRKAVEWGGEFEEVVDPHPVTKLLARPNPYMLGNEFSCMRYMLSALTGNFYQHPIVESLRYEGKSLNRIKELWVMPSQYVKIQQGQPTEDDFVKGYWYGIDATRARFFTPDEVQHFRLPNPSNMYYGLGQVEAGWSTQMLSVAQRQTDQAKYDNHARPDIAVITESANVTISQLKDLQQEWAQNFRGTFRQGSPVFLTGKTQVIPLNWQPTEIGDKEIIIEEIAAITGVPVSLLKANDPNLASAQVGFASWREQTTLPYCRMDEEFLNAHLMPAFGIEDDAFLAYDDPVPENRTEMQAEINVAMQHGTKTRNEIRVMMGDEPADEDNADKLLVPAGLTPIDKVGELPDFCAGGGGFTMGGDKKPADDKKEPESKSMERFQSHEIYTKGDADDTVRDGEPERKIRAFKMAVSRVFTMQRKACMDALYGRKSVDAGTLARIMAAVFNFNEDMAQAVEPHITDLAITGGKAGLAEINMPSDIFAVTNPKVAAFIRQYSIKLAGEVNTYTAERLSKSLADGLEAGEGTSGLSGRVSDLYEDFEGSRSETIARTESARAFVEGTNEAWRESEVVEGKKWRLAAGGCLICRAIARKFANEVVPLDQPFYPLGSVIPLDDGKTYHVDYAPIMGPPGHPNCRCGVVPALKKVSQ